MHRAARKWVPQVRIFGPGKARILTLLFVGASLTAPICIAQAKRPMTFEDMMQMKRLGDTAVSPDGKWLAYSVTSVNLAQNTKTAELWVQAIVPMASGSGPENAAPMK